LQNNGIQVDGLNIAEITFHFGITPFKNASDTWAAAARGYRWLLPFESK
jgi:hypothetical protein